MGKPFERVERLPVPKEVDAAFRKISAAQQGSGRSSHAVLRYGGDGSKTALGRAEKAAQKLAEVEAEAATHFGGDVGRMTTHYKRWVRWGKTAMSPAGLAEEVAGRVARDVEKKRFVSEAAKEGKPSGRSSLKRPRTKA